MLVFLIGILVHVLIWQDDSERIACRIGGLEEAAVPQDTLAAREYTDRNIVLVRFVIDNVVCCMLSCMLYSTVCCMMWLVGGNAITLIFSKAGRRGCLGSNFGAVLLSVSGFV